MPARNSPPKPWPMKWIVLAIIVCIVPYTWLTLRHRKPGPAYLPYADNKERAEVTRLLDAGYRRFPLPLTPRDRPAPEDALPGGLSQRAGGLPPLLQEVLLDPLVLPESVQLLAADAAVAVNEPIRLTFHLSSRTRLSQAQIFVRNEEVTIAPVADLPLAPEQSGATTGVVDVVLPAGTLPAGDYRFSLLAEQATPTWPVTVEE